MKTSTWKICTEYINYLVTLKNLSMFQNHSLMSDSEPLIPDVIIKISTDLLSAVFFSYAGGRGPIKRTLDMQIYSHVY